MYKISFSYKMANVNSNTLPLSIQYLNCFINIISNAADFFLYDMTSYVLYKRTNVAYANLL